MGIIEHDRRGSHEVKVAFELVKKDMLRAKQTFMDDVTTNLSPEKWQGEAKLQFDRAVGIIETTLTRLTNEIEVAKEIYSEMGETIIRADAVCADGVF